MILFQSAVQIHEFHIVICIAKFQDLRGKEDEETGRDIKNPFLKVRETSHHCRIGKLA